VRLRRAYSREVDDELREGSESENLEAPAPKTELRPARGRTFLPEVTGVEFASSRRGYDRDEVDQYVERVSRIVVELEAMRSPDAVIERALADVGEETSAILRRARKAAEEIIADAEGQAREHTANSETQARAVREDADGYNARVRAEGEQVLQDARAEAEKITAQAVAEARRVREDADRYRDQVNSHIEQLARDRHGLIEDLRKLADQFHRTADRALEQIPTHDIGYEGNGGTAAAEHQSA
jgi:DivIVA domain-containing protein